MRPIRPDTTPKPITPELRKKAVELAHLGLSKVGIANAIGMSGKTLVRRCHEDPSLDEEIHAALAAYEAKLIAKADELIAAGEFANAKIVQDILSRRFPDRHGNDPRFRYNTKYYIPTDAMDEDNDMSGNTPPRAAGLLDEAIAAFLDAREGGKE